MRNAINKRKILEFVDIVHRKGINYLSIALTWPPNILSFSETIREPGYVPDAQLPNLNTWYY